MQQLLLAKYSNFEQMINSDYGFLLWLVDTFTIYWHWRVLQMCYSKYDPKTFKNLVPFTIILQYALCAHK